MKLKLSFLVFVLFLLAINLSSADEHGHLYFRDLDDTALEDHLSRLPESPGYRCAKGVRLSLNVLFRGGPQNGKNALDYNEKVLSQWQTVDYKYKKVNQHFRFNNYDIKVLLPAKTCPSEMVRKYGHIEFYYDGVWYSDFRQQASAFDTDEYMAKRSSTHKRCYTRQVIYRLSPKK